MPKSKKKYRINQLLEQLPLAQNRKARAVLPTVLGISAPTFDNYRAITMEENKDIPHHIVVKLEKFFDLKPGELSNCDYEVKPISQYKDDEAEQMAASFGLNK